jgi:hypothetical protein
MLKDTQNIVRLALVFTFAVLLPVFITAQQTKERVMQHRVYRDQPIEVTAIKVNGVEIKPTQKFRGNSDWLNGMTVTLKNASSKPIAYVSLLIGAYYEKNGERMKRDGEDMQAGIQLQYGAQPPRKGESVPAFSPLLMPDETIDIVLSEELRNRLNSLLKESNATTDVTEISVRVFEVFFEGDSDTMWQTGRMLHRDPNNPRRWIRVSPKKSLAKNQESPKTGNPESFDASEKPVSG